MSLGEKIKELRVRRGLSQEQLSEKINAQFNASINKGMISKWENNIVEPRIEVVRMLAMYFNVSLDDLLDIPHKQEEEIQTIAAHHEGEDWTEEELKTIEEFKRFVKSQRKNKE